MESTIELVSREKIRSYDTRAIDEFGMPGIALMESAGRVATDVLTSRLRQRGLTESARVGILCGSGNNGGDGYVIARHLAARGHRPDVILLAARDRISGDAKTNLELLIEADASVVELGEVDDPMEHVRALLDDDYDAWVDAMLGTGLSSDVRGVYADVIVALNEVTREAGAFVLAVDTPSGLDVDSGQVLGCAVRADVTTTFGRAKPGLFISPGRAHAGDVEVVDLGFPAPVIEENPPRGHVLTGAVARRCIGRRERDVHKGTFGHVLAVAGTPGKTGAAVMTGTGALRAGAGLVTVGTHPDCLASIANVSWELMASPIVPSGDDDDRGDALTRALEMASVVALGPGLGDTSITRSLLADVVEAFDGPIVLDADGLNVAAHDIEVLAPAAGRLVLTPHPGEMSRLLGMPTGELLANRLSLTRELASRLEAIVALKTADTIVAHPNRRYAVNSSGTPGMASAGMGDVLTGMIAGMVATGLSTWDAVRTAVWIHGRAGEHAAASTGQHALTATALLDALGPVQRGLELRAAPD